MPYIYSNSEREADPHALPDIEVFQSVKGDGWNLPRGWYWMSCFPGCMPDGEPAGPFKTRAEAEAAAREEAEMYGNRNGGAAFDDMCD